jgi:hypothetical protein
MTHAVPRPRTSGSSSPRSGSARPRHPLGAPHNSPEANAPLPKREPGTALDAIHRDSVIPRRDMTGGPPGASVRWFSPHQKPEG